MREKRGRTFSASCFASSCSCVQTEMPVMEWSYGWEMDRMKARERAIAMSVESLEWDSVIYWLIHFGSLARLSARAKR